MNGIWNRCLAFAGVFVFVLASMSRGEVPDPSPTGKLYPDVLKHGPPPAIKAGTRLTFFGGSATIPGVRMKLAPDENGNWIDPKTGKKYGEKEVQGSGGVGYTIARIAHVDKQAAVVNTSTYLFDPLAKTVSFTGGSGMVTDAAAGADYWIHPAYLKTIKEVREAGVFIGRMPYVIGDRKYNAIRFQTESANGHTAYVYDTDSGILIFYGSSLIGAGVATVPGPDGRVGAGAGSTFLAHNMLVEVKDIDLPWKDAPTPKWVNEFREIRYDGGITTAIQGVQPMTQAMSYVIAPKVRENGWVRFQSATTTQVYGFPPQKSTTEGANGHAGYAGLWISPQAMGKLKVGQVIETSDFLKTKTVISAIGGGFVTMSEVGQLHRLDAAYDANTGVLAGVTLQQRNQISLTTTQLKLTGQR